MYVYFNSNVRKTGIGERFMYKNVLKWRNW